ncbi:MAG: 2-C-methyl-D-erythritol 2,4-cyclodiphosphate synthase [Candidatus Krumholzibacteria bacterium]|nr:2-C-methyl-D-erythritol 2,4-cyclodiphosphate synthase [Candidatus Krumholzibacteria bacterium]
MGKSSFRIGIGYDIHPLVDGRTLVLGGVKIDHEKGLMGHSDADALVHALCDALLGALNLGDLGVHFPETEEFKDISSLKLLGSVAKMMRAEGYRLVNADCVLLAERPKLSCYRAEMTDRIAKALDVSADCISIKATRGEGLGPVGEGRAIAANAIVLLERVDSLR